MNTMFNSKARNKRPLQRTQTTRSSLASNAFGFASSLSANKNVRSSNFGATENERLFRYEDKIKNAFSKIETTLKKISSLQHEDQFISKAQDIAFNELGFNLPNTLLSDCWIKSLDIAQLYAWCVFETFQKMSNEFFIEQPLMLEDDLDFQEFLKQCGFHTLDVSPCADGRLAHVISYVLRLPYKSVRRKSYAGALFDIEDSLEKWIETEMLRHREGKPNQANEPTRYLKMAAYHFSSVDPDREGCAAHGSDDSLAAAAATERLYAFRQGVENSFCCGASIDLLLIGVDTDTDAIRIHIPDNEGDLDSTKYIDVLEISKRSGMSFSHNFEAEVSSIVQQHVDSLGSSMPVDGMLRFITRLLKGNFAQISYVCRYHNGAYSDTGHQEKFIGMGIGFEEVQLRNLTYFSYLKTVEEAANDLDVGIKIFSGLNVSRGLPVPVIIRYDYHGKVPGAKARAEARCLQLDGALRQRYHNLVDKGLLHTRLMVRDCNADEQSEVIACSVGSDSPRTH